MPPKRLTAEEKSDAMYQLILTSGDFYSIKELEKVGPKMGIQQQMVKDIVDSLVDDGKVEREKIGSANYYWSFASQASNVAQSAFERSESAVAEAEAKLTTAQAMLQTAQKQRAPSDQRTQQIKYLAEVEAECESFSAQLGVSATLDPSTVSENLHLVRLARSAAVGHTENVGILMKFASHWLQVEPDAARHFLELPHDWEEIEDLPETLSPEEIKAASH